MPLRHVRELTAQERAVLTKLYKSSPEVEVVHRSHAVLLSADGWRVSRIAELLRVDQSTVHRWLDRFEADGLAGLATEWSDGRPPAWDESYEWLLVETMRHDPRWYGLEQSLWTCSLLAGYLAEQTGISLSAERVRVLLHQHGIHLKQPIPVVHSRDPQYDPKGSRRRRSATPTNRPLRCWMSIRPNWPSTRPAPESGRRWVCPGKSRRPATTANRWCSGRSIAVAGRRTSS